MNLTYEVKEKGYTILNNGTPWMVQESYIPFPAPTLEESAQLHIADIINQNNSTPAPTIEEELKQIRTDMDNAILELTLLIAMGGNV